MEFIDGVSQFYQWNDDFDDSKDIHCIDGIDDNPGIHQLEFDYVDLGSHSGNPNWDANILNSDSRDPDFDYWVFSLDSDEIMLVI